MTEAAASPVRVLVLSRNYPNPALPAMGLWAERLTRAARGPAEPVVVAPVPWRPPLIPWPGSPRYRDVPPRRTAHGVEVLHPRVPLGPGVRGDFLDVDVNYPFVRRAVDRLRARFPFDLIHAHFVHPDGVIAARLGRRYGVPVVTTEHAEWEPWFAARPRTRAQVLAALADVAVVAAVSRTTAEGVRRASGGRAVVDVLPNVVDGEVFRPPAGGAYDPDLVAFVGAARRVKGLDVLVRALRVVVAARPRTRLLVIGEPFYRSWRRDEREARDLLAALGLAERVVFAGRRSEAEVAGLVAGAAVLAMPSRRETFGAAAAEALACGVPVVVARCGGPEEFVSAEDGRTAPVDDPDAFAAALLDVLGGRARFDGAAMRARILARCDVPVVRAKIAALYARALGR